MSQSQRNAHLTQSDVIIGQEVVCPDGLGRVHDITIWNGFVSDVQVHTYMENRSCNWDVKNVTLISPFGDQPKKPECDHRYSIEEVSSNSNGPFHVVMCRKCGDKKVINYG